MLKQKNKTKKEKTNPFIDFLTLEFSFGIGAKIRSVKAKNKPAKKNGKSIINKHPDHLLLDMLIKEKHRKVLSKMGKIEKALDYHLHKSDKRKSKEIHDIEDRLVAEWQKEFVALREDVLKSVPEGQRKNYRKMLTDHIKESVNHPHHLYPLTIPINEKSAVGAKRAHSALRVVTAAVVALMLALSVISISPSFSDKIISATDKILLYPIVKTDQIFNSGNLTNKKIVVDKKANPQIDKKVLADFIINNRTKLSEQTGDINLTENDIYGIVAGVEESVSEVTQTEEPKATKKCVLIRLKKMAEKIGDTQKQISVNLEEKLNKFLMNF